MYHREATNKRVTCKAPTVEEIMQQASRERAIQAQETELRKRSFDDWVKANREASERILKYLGEDGKSAKK